MKKRKMLSGIILFLSAAAVLLYGTGPIVRIAGKINFPAREGNMLIRLEDENISAAVLKNFTIPLGGEGIILVEYVRKRGNADISITKNGQEVAGMEIDRPDRLEDEALANPGARGELKTVLSGGIYTIRVEAGEFGGVIACSIMRKDNRDMP